MVSWVWHTKLALMVTSGPHGSGVVGVPVRIPSMCQIDLFENYCSLIGSCAKKKLNNYAKNVSINI